MAGFAEHTSVPVKQSKGDIEAICGKHGADKFGLTVEPGRAVVIFQAHGRTVRFVLPLPEGQGTKLEQEQRAKWRRLLLVIKAKFEAVENRIETFEEAFLAHIVMDDGQTVYEKAQATMLLPAPSKMKVIK